MPHKAPKIDLIGETDQQPVQRSYPTDFENIADRLVSRREFLGTGAAFGATAFVVGTSSLVSETARASGRLDFKAVPTNTLDTVTLAEGYDWYVLTRWGDGLWSDSKEFDQNSRGTWESQELAIGDNNDGMSLFTYRDRTILAVNNEYVNPGIFYGNRASGLAETPDDVRKGMAGHGVSIFEIHDDEGQWKVVADSGFNRRITATTPMEITGPARSHDSMKTEADPEGVESVGTWSNCGCGQTPWGTYLTCEEGSNKYFTSSDENFEPTEDQIRYGINTRNWATVWPLVDNRFDVEQQPNEPHRTGYVVEIDPLDPQSKPKKRTALGRTRAFFP
jgi:secreted PhoX family phosphatase